MKSLDIQVSVCIVTYNQEKYIAECLDSLLSQKTDFKFEIIVGEDCSTDGTRAVIQKYIDQYPELIVPLFYEANVGPVENLKRVYKKARGRYIAHMDGDDLALPNKLQKQFSILEMNPDCSICVHNMNAIDGKSQKMNRAFSLFDEKKYSLLDMYLINPFFIHSSKMFVNKIDDYIDQLNENALDIEVHIEQAKQGDIYFIGECLGVYRQFVGVTYEEKLINPLIPERIQDVYYNFPSEKFNVKDISKVKKKYAYILLQYTNHYILHGDLRKSKFFLKKSFYYNFSFLSFLFCLVFIWPSFFRKILMIRSQRKWV
ncbi:glycosyltransferase family 2 protein [Acinetobacter bereziniae]|uniref:glycosyltransferase family 2 protein n=1 Tax=Acinetobacter bereziniae TaxID=106648 RepID=UPI001902BCDE|nr:glycosyltransferase family A protein [Acinetobacter bereziniae]MBJ8451576.1 glycosyltransferase family 2 protein [Acinetobacter bereziniae]MBJ8458018.1 glycosyltransferase family 2 protein [Acinetobacter bereziniae]